MKADYYFTLLDGLLATAVYHPHNLRSRFGTPSFWSVPINQVLGTPAISLSTTVTWFPVPAECFLGIAGEKGMRTSATRVCGYRLSLHS